jgi:hypothetical protein
MNIGRRIILAVYQRFGGKYCFRLQVKMPYNATPKNTKLYINYHPLEENLGFDIFKFLEDMFDL